MSESSLALLLLFGAPTQIRWKTLACGLRRHEAKGGAVAELRSDLTSVEHCPRVEVGHAPADDERIALPADRRAPFDVVDAAERAHHVEA